MRSGYRLALACLLLPGGLAAQQATALPAHGAAEITAEDVSERIFYLASDELRGRDTPSPELETAASYAAAEFARFGLQPGGDEGSFIQRYPLPMRGMDRDRVLFSTGDNSYLYARDYFVAPAGGRDSTSAPAVYVGTARPGLVMPASARGRIAVFALTDTLSSETMQGWQQNLMSAVVSGAGAGAVGVVVVLDPGFRPEMVAQLAQLTAGQNAPLPVVGITHQALAPLFTAAGHDLAQLRAATPEAAVELPGSFVIRTGLSAEQPRVPNVVGILPGSDPALAGEYVLVSAHFDHVGVGSATADGDSIFNGADDNASGTTAVLEMAQAFAAQATSPRRSIIFLLVSGEEKGLFGSRYYAENPTVPVAQIVANINLDMVGRNHPDTVYAIGPEYSTLGELAQQVATANADLRVTVAPDPMPQEQLFFRSDHYSFAAKGIPAIFFTTGLHDQYHRQADHAELIDTDKLARITRYTYLLAERIANADERPEWTEAGRAAVRQSAD